MNRIPAAIKQPFYEQVWALTSEVPEGRVATYGQIAKLIPEPAGISAEEYRKTGARWVGMALGACPDDVPWHRVINSQGKISPRAEAGKQKQLLQAEGVLFLREKIDLLEYQWGDHGLRDDPSQSSLF